MLCPNVCLKEKAVFGNLPVSSKDRPKITCCSLMSGSMSALKGKLLLIFSSFLERSTQLFTAEKTSSLAQEIQRPALQQGPDLYLEPQWRWCLCTDRLTNFSCRRQQSAAGALLFCRSLLQFASSSMLALVGTLRYVKGLERMMILLE